MNKIQMMLLAFTMFLLSCSDPSEPESEGKTYNLKVMTYNIHIGNPPSQPDGYVDLIATAGVINKEAPDLVALQEVDRFTNRSGTNLDQAKELAKLTGMEYYFAKAIDRSGGDYGCAILSRFPIISSESHSLPIAPGTQTELRVLAVVEVELENKQKIIFAGTHIDHRTDQTRNVQSQEILKALEKHSDKPIILGGDFNMIPQNNTWDILKEEFDWGCLGDCPFTFPAGRPNTTIDYLLLNEEGQSVFQVKDYYTPIDRYASDHLPVVMDLTYTD